MKQRWVNASAEKDGEMEQKIAKKLKKHLQSLAKHNPEVTVSGSPTQILFVANSSVLCGVSFEDLERIFLPFDESCRFVVYPDCRSYSFVEFSSVESAIKASHSLHGKVPTILSEVTLPFYVAFVKNVPAELTKSNGELPSGLRTLESFIDADEEAALLSYLQACSVLEKHLKSRRVIHFGYQFDYGKNNASLVAEDPIPSVCDPIIDRMMQQRIFSERPDQLTVNIYEPGDGIPAHIDTHSAFGDTIVSLSLKSDVVMEFRDSTNTTHVKRVLLPRFSLLILQGESRYCWKHGIAKRKNDVNPENHRLMKRSLRVSFTFRKVAFDRCQCPFIEYCDWDRNGLMRIPESDNHGRSIESEYVASVYESIAEHFDSTRHSRWKAVNNFLRELPSCSVLYDVGCGNGKYITAKDELIKIGCDLSEKLCMIAHEKSGEVLRADALSLPFKNDSADAVISIAVIHHMSTSNRRKRAVHEILRCLHSGGRACVTVWSFEQKRDDVVSEYLKMRSNKRNVPRNRRDSNGRLRIHEGRDFTQQDMLVPWQCTDRQNFLRYYHLFIAGELEELVNDVGGCVIEKTDYEQGNWILVFRKV